MFRRRSTPSIHPQIVHDVLEKNVGLAVSMDAGTIDRLTEVTIELVGSKRWEAVGPIELSDEVEVTIAANAAIPILALGTSLYRKVNAILIRPTRSVSTGRRAGPAVGTVADDPVDIVGLATPNSGPISLAWDAVLAGSRNPSAGRNVVIHEFAHKIDMSDGYADGMPPVRGALLDHWVELFADEYERTDPRPSDDVLRPYAWASPAEFFAVSTEAFFCTGPRLAEAKPALYEALRDFYNQDPASMREVP